MRGEGKITRRLVAIAGGETVDTHAGNDVNTGDGVNVVLGEEGYVVLVEISRAKLRSNADDLLRAASSIRRVIEEVVRIVNLGDKVAAKADGVVRQHLRETDLVSEHIAMRIVPLVHLGAAGESIVIAPVKTANVRVPCRIFQRGCRAEI